MGHFSHNCKLTGLPITGGTKVVLFPLRMRKNLWDNSEEKLRKYGSSYMCSNEGSWLKFIPYFFPIKGEYDEYGGIENIIEDDNTKILESYYGLTIQQICDILTCGRKDDGYSDSLKPIKDPNSKDEYGKPVYLDRYKDLIAISCMWIHGEVYEKLVEKSDLDKYYDRVDLGTPAILEALGFNEIKGDEKEERYKLRFKQGDIVLNSDGNWLEVKDYKYGIYTFSDLKKYCKDRGLDLDISEVASKDRIEQLYDYVLPKTKSVTRPNVDNESLKHLTDKEVKDLFKKFIRLSADFESDHTVRQIQHMFLKDYHEYDSTPISSIYFNEAKNGKLRQNLVEFWRFDRYMFDLGRFYDIVGTGPQDGAHDSVLKVLEISAKILRSVMEERGYFEEEEIENGE